MVLPIVALGHPVLRKKTEAISRDYPGLDEIIRDMFETMYNAHGVGLAAPQVNLSIRLFIVDGSPMDGEGADPSEVMLDFKKVFINPQKLEETGNPWAYEEGCLSIPDIREDVMRQPTITLRYQNEQFEEITETFSGMKARIIQHEYDHLEGVLFTDYVSGLRKKLLRNRLARISKGQIPLTYPMKFPNKR
jgi:peptide deformylase